MAVKLFGTPRELHGSRARINGAFNLALVAEGYTQADHTAGLFWTDADKVVQELKKTPPFTTFGSLLNIFGVPAISDQSAQSITTRCPAQAEADRKTAFKVQFCVGNSPRAIKGDESLVKQVVRVDASLPFVDQFLVIVNSKLHGGFGPPGVGWVTTDDPGWPQSAVHELGHSAFGLTDEYEYNEPGDPPTAFIGIEPAGPNVTADLAIPTFKWRSLVQSFVTWPSTVPSPAGTCTFNHSRAPGVAADAVGAFEGAAHRACKVYRPAFRCKMREHADPFCPVCARQIVPTAYGTVVRESSPTSFPLTSVPGSSAIWTHVVPLPDPARPGPGRSCCSTTRWAATTSCATPTRRSSCLSERRSRTAKSSAT